MKPYTTSLGQRYGKLIVVSYAYSKDGKYWNCRCDCGGTSIVPTRSLNAGVTRSCGCGSTEQRIRNCRTGAIKRRTFHPYTRKLRELHCNMIDRCYNPSNKRWEQYGGKGIVVCVDWQVNRTGFYRWVLDQGWKPGLQIDRKDVAGHYQPSNCRFVGSIVQANNTTRNRILTWQGITQTVAQWSRELNISRIALQHRVERKWPIERIMSQPYRVSKHA